MADTVVGYKLKVLSWFILVVKPFPFLLLTTYYLPLITYYLLLTTYYLPPITYYFPFPHPNQSFPFAYNIRPSKRTIPTTCAYSKNLSLGFLPVIISIRVNNAWPPSNAGMGNKFIKANMIDNNAVILQKCSQSQLGAINAFAIPLNPPIPL